MQLGKAALVREVSRVCEVPLSEAKTILEAMFDSLVRALKDGERVELRNFGTFSVQQRRGRRARNPRTGLLIQVEPKKVLRFKAGKDLDEMLNGEGEPADVAPAPDLVKSASV